MKVVQINMNCGGGSVGKICVAVSNLLNDRGIENYVLYALGSSDHPNGIRYTTKKAVKLAAMCAKVSGFFGFTSVGMTRRLIRELDRIQPDIVHMHNMHNHNANLSMLFAYLRKKGIKVFWTFHDCWAFTGYCAYFTMCGCDRWKTQCEKCPQWKSFSWFFDQSRHLYRMKKRAMQQLDMTVITPSRWLGDLVKQSFLGQYPVKVVPNGIDLNVFRPTEGSFRERYHCEDKHIVLSVAYAWDQRKGGDVMIEMARRLGDKYQIVMVGTDAATDKLLPDNVISIHRTNNQQELAEIYTAADVFVIPTREENYPTVNMEALACGTPVITFRTGGSPEMLDESCGIVVDCDDWDAFEHEIRRVCEEGVLTREACLEKAKQFSDKDCFQRYIELYIGNDKQRCEGEL